ncbi:DUF4936 family protein [Massilia sp. MS-15]|uniref:DUF4936 family protein n=1 Tax=Massilia sp. MS-15 TaxID=2878200 RepID=UPI001CD7ABD8|nr:DUF4936 family protein [Massilia sp. MS-15]MCA1246580.1 DUF4936 family protein [Massilia sp. MS-15]
MIDLYVYYKVRDTDAAHLAPRVRAMQAQLGSPAQLKRRPEARAGLQTWMEVYPSVPAAFAGAVEQAALEAGLHSFIDGPRRSEVFTDLPSSL